MDWSDENYIAIISSSCGIFFSGIYILPPPPHQPGQAWHEPRQLVFDSTLFTDGLLLLVISSMISSYTRYTDGAHTLSHHSHHMHKYRVSVAIHISSTVYWWCSGVTQLWISFKIYRLSLSAMILLLGCRTIDNLVLWKNPMQCCFELYHDDLNCPRGEQIWKRVSQR